MNVYLSRDQKNQEIKTDMKLEHIGIAVSDVEETRNLFQLVFGATPYKTEDVLSEGVRTHFYDAGGVKLELLESISPDSSIERFIKKYGPGLHHLAFAVDSAAADVDRLSALGLRVLGEAPKLGADGKIIFFVHPKDTAGVLMEFCSPANR